jgi:hypothetical protein
MERIKMPKRKKGRKKGSKSSNVQIKHKKSNVDKGIKTGGTEKLEKGMRRSTYY